MKIVDHEALLAKVKARYLTAQRTPGATVYGSFGDGVQDGWGAAERLLWVELNAAHDVQIPLPITPATPRDTRILVWDGSHWYISSLSSEDTQPRSETHWLPLPPPLPAPSLD